jgi:D-alanyl-D-alanine carboxypeptidase
LKLLIVLALSTIAGTQANMKVWLDGRAASFSGAVLVAHGDTIQANAAYGPATAGGANSPDTRFNIGSINKTFTALAIAQLIQRGRLSLDDPLAKHLPEYPNRDAAAKITIRDLITHRSGVAQFMGADFGDGTVEQMTRAVGSEPQVFEPRTRQAYSNGGYIVLGRIIEVLSGKSYAAYIEEHVYRPAGMTTGGTAGNPAGGGYFTATDLFRFARALRTGKLLDARMTDYVLNGTFSGEASQKFGFALREQVVGGRRFIGNGGGAPGVNAEFRFEPSGDYTVVALANASPPAATQLLADILLRLAGPAAGL